jgi:hypothetical protein
MRQLARHHPRDASTLVTVPRGRDTLALLLSVRWRAAARVATFRILQGRARSDAGTQAEPRAHAARTGNRLVSGRHATTAAG